MDVGKRARLRASAAGMAIALVAAAGCGGASTSTRAPAAWSAPNGDPANHRRVDGPIDAGSVARLRVAWRVPLRGGDAATPIVEDGVVYAQDLQSNVLAIDLASGRVRWRHDFEASDIGPNGVNVVGGRVFGATQSNAFALDAKTGRALWSVQLSQHPGDAIDMAPGYGAGMVYVSTAVGGNGAVGTLWALDAKTGTTRWRWQQVPSDLWGRPDVNSGGGLWHPPAFDGTALYASTANPLPFPGTAQAGWGASRPGANRWTDSLVKLDARTGRILWARQVLPHDLYDWDLEGPAILDEVGGRRLAITAGKMGIVYAFDAADGRLVWKRPVGVHNGHDDDALLAMRGRFHPHLPAIVYPGWWGGVETQMASDGSTVYVPVNDFGTVYDSPSRLTAPTDPSQGRGEMEALDVATGQVVWDRRLPFSPYGAATISSDLVFTTTYDGTVWALRRSDGVVVWKDRLPSQTNAPVAVAGDTLLAAASVPAEGQEPQLVAYRLGGAKRGAGGG